MNGGRSPVPGEARVGAALGRLPKVRDVALATLDEEVRIEAILDTGATHCVIPRLQATFLGFSSENRLGTHRIRGVGGFVTAMDRHRFEYVQVGTARAYDMDLLIGDALPGFMLLGMSFIERFTTTLDLDAGRVIFRTRTGP